MDWVEEMKGWFIRALALVRWIIECFYCLVVVLIVLLFMYLTWLFYPQQSEEVFHTFREPFQLVYTGIPIDEADDEKPPSFIKHLNNFCNWLLQCLLAPVVGVIRFFIPIVVCLWRAWRPSNEQNPRPPASANVSQHSRSSSNTSNNSIKRLKARKGDGMVEPTASSLKAREKRRCGKVTEDTFRAQE